MPENEDLIILIEDNIQSPKYNVRSDIVNVKNTQIPPSSPMRRISQDKLLTLYEFENININDNDNAKTIECQTDTSEDMNEIIIRKDKLYKTIKENKKKITTSLYIISAKYDLIYFRYNRISLLILIISTVSTFIEAIRLTIVNYENDNKESSMNLIISKNMVSLIINMISLLLGTLLTILSSIVKFRNYRENMEKLKNIHDTLFNYKILYNKQKDIIDYFTISNTLTIELFNKLVENVDAINKEIKDINIFENIRIKDLIKFNRIKVNHDIELKKLSNKRELEFLKLTIESTKNKQKYDTNNISNINAQKKISCCNI